MIATEKGLRRTVAKAIRLHNAFMLFRRLGLEYSAYAAKRDRDNTMWQARMAKRRITSRAAS